jgi:hypothetical protein
VDLVDSAGQDSPDSGLVAPAEGSGRCPAAEEATGRAGGSTSLGGRLPPSHRDASAASALDVEGRRASLRADRTAAGGGRSRFSAGAASRCLCQTLSTVVSNTTRWWHPGPTCRPARTRVADGFSDVIGELIGERSQHARATMGVASLAFRRAIVIVATIGL